MQLNDAQAMADEYPTFHAPDPLQLEEIGVGHLVKVSNNYDRFWVLVTTVDGQKIAGTINNELVGQLGKFGDEIFFEKRHVYAFERVRG